MTGHYHDTYDKFPIGVRDNVPGGWGISFWIGLLPGMEQAAVYNQFTFDGLSPGYTGQGVGNTANGPLVRGKVFAFLKCPSSPLPDTKDTGSGIQTQIANYAGISGAVDDAIFVNAGTSKEIASDNCCSCPPTGFHGRGGVLLANRSLSFRDLTDGTSNVMVVSEQSDFAKNAAGAPVQITNNHGWMMGTNGLSPNTTQRRFNLTTIRYAPNAVKQTGGSVLPGVCNNDGANNGIFSPHTGGVQCLLGDGSCRFLSENIDLTTLKRLATRDDGQVLGDF